MLKINSYDIDGVIFMNDHYTGLKPANRQDIIVTGRSFTHADDTYKMLHSREIYNQVFFNPKARTHNDYSREESGKHKGRIFCELLKLGIQVDLHFEDDPRQKEYIEKIIAANNSKIEQKFICKTKVIIVQSWEITHLEQFFEKNPNE